ncbi:MAG TPA: VWA domain-containing protein, partial [Lacipirellulaceae bacterium]|nr:VWA domain-containing protein [Lacipirellulaceae bacterium]
MLRNAAIVLALVAMGPTCLADDAEVVIHVKHGKPVVDGTVTSPLKGHRPAVDIAILLDTSNSMDGLIGQARKQLWTIVQQFAKAKKQGQTPELRVALFEYGNSNLPASEGYIRQVVPLTDNLDKLSESLFSLKTCGGDEYCGQV